MHEMSLAQGILTMVEEAAVQEHFVRVKQLRIEVGVLAGVELEALHFALSVMSQQGVLQGAEFVIETPLAQAWCLSCSEQIEVTQRGQACPKCGSYQVQAISGTQLRVIDMIVLDQ